MAEQLLKGFVEVAVGESINHLNELRGQRQAETRPLLAREEARLHSWLTRRRARIEEQLVEYSPTSQQAVRARQNLEEAEKYVRDRAQNWKLAHFEAADRPTTRLVLAIEGVH